jgi:hypothetical protein
MKCGKEKERILIGSRRTRGGSGGGRTNVVASRTANIATYNNVNSGPVILVNSYKGDNYFYDS